MSVAIVTDSTADLSPEQCVRWGVTVVPALVVIGGKALRDGVDLQREDFYRRLETLDPPPTTAAPSSGEFAAVYRRLLDEGAEAVLSIHCASTLSGIYGIARLAAQPFGDRVRVMDSGSLSMGLGFQVLAAAQAARQGATLDEAEQAAHALRPRLHFVAMLDGLEHLRRSGRVSWLQAGMGALLRLKPFVGLREGEVLRLPPVRTRSRGLAQLRRLLEDLGPLEHLALLHTDAEDDARALADGLPNLPEGGAFQVVWVTPVIGVHVGPRGVGFVAVQAV